MEENELHDQDERSVRPRMTGKIKKIIVDRETCIGAASCVVVAQNTFRLDEENKAVIVDADGHDDDTLLLAAQSCPVLAIHLYDEKGNKIFPN